MDSGFSQGTIFESNSTLPSLASGHQDNENPPRTLTEQTEEKSEKSPEGNSNLMKTRLLLDQQYVSQWHEGRRIRKKPQHMNKLVEYFNQNPIWDYAEKVRIAEEIGMTYNQVAKWNWDYRKKQSISTSRLKK